MKKIHFKKLTVACLSSVTAAFLLVGIMIPLFKTEVSGGITFSKGQIARVVVGPTDVPYSSFRVGDYGSDYDENDELHPSKRYFSFFVYDNVNKTEKHIFDTVPGQFALSSVIDENFYFSTNWESDYGGWIDIYDRSNYGEEAGNYHVEVDYGFATLDELNVIKAVFEDLGYFVFPAYVNGSYFIRINQYFSASEAHSAIADIEEAYNKAIEELNYREPESSVPEEPSSVPDPSNPDSGSDASSDIPSSDTSSDISSSNVSSDIPSSDMPSSDIESSDIPSSDITSSDADVSSDPSSNEGSASETISSEIASDDIAPINETENTGSESTSSGTNPENSSESESNTDSDNASSDLTSDSSSNVSSEPTDSEENSSESDSSAPSSDVTTSVPDNSSDVSSDNSSDSTSSEPEEPEFVYPEYTYTVAGGGKTCITVVDERSGVIYFEFDCTDKWLRIVPSVSGTVYHRVYSMTASAANRNLGRTYNGTLDIARVPDEDYNITTVNNVDLDSYLIGVLMREMGNSKNEALYEAYRTQAIVARTYALRKILTENVHGRNKTFGYDICDGSHCQAYRGNTISATAMVTRAVTTTSKMVITVKNSQGNDTLIEAIYCASNGGYTLSNYQYWNTSLRSYLQQVEDTYENLDTATNGRWETRFSPEDLGKYINYLKVNKPSHFNLLRMYTHEGFITGKEYNNPERLSSNVGDVVKFYAEVVAPLGEIPLKLVFEDENGIKTYIQFGANIKSFMSAASGMGINGFESAVVKSPNFHIYYAFNDYYVTADGSSALYEKRLDETYILTVDGVETIKSYPHELKIADVTGFGFLPSKNYNYIIKGTGWGHAVGMSQEGAFGRSRAGHTADQIIKHYYTGVDITLIEE